MFTVLIKIDALVDRNVLGNGGTQNLHRLGSLYHSTGYQDYFSGQIDLLEEKVSQHLAK